ncbi:hypothetical protein V8C35DRAFT_213029 [Trichoderma chlorosporum]
MCLASVMDGLSDDSPFRSVVIIADWIDRGRAWLLVLLFAIFWHGVTRRQADIVIVLICLTWKQRSSLTALYYGLICSKLTLSSLALAIIVFIGHEFVGNIRRWRYVGESQSATTAAYLIPCRVTHSRELPEKHSFSYSYLAVGIHVGYRGNVNGMISVDAEDSAFWWRMRSWLRVDSADYLERGNNKLGLRGKLDAYLRSQDANPVDYPHVFLVTAPKILGYQFNPVSFWYLYSPDKKLSAILLEMNNIFGERRPYLVPCDTAGDTAQISSHETSNPTSVWVKASWNKDFHMSPFSSRKGSYSLLAKDPFEGNMESLSGIDISLDLVSSKGQPKLVARLLSDCKPIGISQMGPLKKAGLILKWAWVGFLTFPRIVRQAASLFFYHQLHVWYRPEPLKDSIGRLASSTEAKLESVFRQYLRLLVEQSSNPLSVTYVPCGLLESKEETFTSSETSTQQDRKEHVTIKILTPAFYSRFVHYAHDFEAIFCELADNCTIWVDRPEMLPRIFLKKHPPPLHAPSFLDFLYFKTIQRLRRRPPRIMRPMTSADSAGPTTTPEDVRGFRISPMDAFVLQLLSKETRASYRSLLVRLFVADRFFFILPEIIDAILLAGRFGVVWWLLSFGWATPC